MVVLLGLSAYLDECVLRRGDHPDGTLLFVLVPLSQGMLIGIGSIVVRVVKRRAPCRP